MKIPFFPASTSSSENRKIDLLLNNAGIIDWEDMNRVRSIRWKSLSHESRRGPYGLAGVLSCLRKSPDPLVVNLSSRLGSISLRGNTQLGGAIAYQCSKAALNMLTKQAAIDLSSVGIRVISISPDG